MPAYRRTNFLIDRPFQFRFTFYIGSWIFALSVVYPLMIYNLYDYFLALAAYDPTGPTLAAIKTSRHDIVKVLIVMQAVFLVMLTALNIFVSHRIAGPIYKLKQALKAVDAEHPLKPVKFRKMDHFHDLADTYNGMVGRLGEAFGNNARLAAEAAGKLESALARGNPDPEQLKEVVSVLKRISQQASSEQSSSV